jgi:hypothetical protein
MVISLGRKCPISFPRDACLHQNLCAEKYSSHWQKKNYKTWRPTQLKGLPDFGSFHRPLHVAFSFTSQQIKFPWALLAFLSLISIQVWHKYPHHPRTLAMHYQQFPHVRWRTFLAWDGQIEPVNLGGSIGHRSAERTLLYVISHPLMSAIRFPNSMFCPHEYLTCFLCWF